MPPVCTVCRSPDRVEIDRLLISGAESTRAIASRHPNLSRSPIERHARRCLSMTDPGSRLQAAAARAELAAVAATAVERATELLDREEARGSGRGTVAALGALSRVLLAAERLYPPADEPPDTAEVRVLLLALVETVDDPASRSGLLAALTERGAADLAGALAEAWSRRPAVLTTAQDKEIKA